MRIRSALLLTLSFSLARCSCEDSAGGGGPGSGDGAIGADGSTAGDGSIGSGDGATGADGSTAACISGLESIALSPQGTMVTVDGLSAAPISFTAMGTFSGGRMELLDPARLIWSATRADQTPPGTIHDGVLQPNPAAGGVVTVSATDGCASGSATITFFLDVVVGMPSDPGPWQGTPTTQGMVPSLVYPSDQTRFPRNIYRTLFQWRAGAAMEFRLEFLGPSSRVVVYTGGAHPLCATAMPRAGCWEADETAWGLIAGSNAGEMVTWTVDGLDRSTATPTVRRSASISIGFSKRDVPGAIFYWSTTSKGVRRANIRARDPEDYITGTPSTTYADGDQIKCVACHVVSRSGRYLAAPVDASSGHGLRVFTVTSSAPPPQLVKEISDTDGHGFATISPDDARMVAAWRGRMWMLDRATGAPLGDLELGMLQATHPDWSPAGDRLVFATGSGDAPARASLALSRYDRTQSTFGAPSILVHAEGDRTNLFPMFSPDGEWIAFSRGKGGHGDDEAQLFLVRGSTAAAMPAIDLVRANRVVSNRMTDGRHENSQPTWAPPGDFAWVAFNSKREYGVVHAEGQQQIWVAAIDLDEAAQGRDPSSPAFRLQFQGLEENNHRAFWTLDVREPPDAGPGGDGGAPDAAAGGPDAGAPDTGVACIPAGDVCDPLTDSCCAGSLCDTRDDGMTYSCVPAV